MQRVSQASVLLDRNNLDIEGRPLLAGDSLSKMGFIFIIEEVHDTGSPIFRSTATMEENHNDWKVDR